MSNPDRINTGALFDNDNATNPRAPSLKGTINVDGVEYWLSAWKQTSQAGNPYISLKLTIKEGQRPNREGIRDQINPQAQERRERREPLAPRPEDDDSIPF